MNEIVVVGRRGEGRSIDRTLTDDDIAYFNSLSRVRAVTPVLRVLQAPLMVWEGENRGTTSLYYVDLEAERAVGMQLAAGRFPQSSREVIVGFHLAERLVAENPADLLAGPLDVEGIVGTRLDIRLTQNFGGIVPSEYWIPLEIVGVVAMPVIETEIDSRVLISEGLLAEIEAFTQTPRGELLPTAISPTERAEYIARAAERPRAYDGVVVHAMRVNDAVRITDALLEAGFVVNSIARQLHRLNTIFSVVQAGLVLIGTFAVLIASVGIYNTMTMAVTERAQDIGIMKAIGAHPQAIQRVFLLESSYIGFLGALIGVGASYLLSVALNTFMPTLLHRAFDLPLDDLLSIRFSAIPPVLVLVSVAISVGVAILSGLRPAKKATKIDVLQALRRDL